MPILKNELSGLDYEAKIYNLGNQDNNMHTEEVHLPQQDVENLKNYLSRFTMPLNIVVNDPNIQECREMINTLVRKLMSISTPSTIDMPQRGSIRSLHEHVTNNRLGSRTSNVAPHNEVEIGDCPRNDRRHI